ncbi:hypothetical protein [Streptomyces sp. NEAU-H3]|uniref:hypothetical protein n=1 Tax=Streptomyces sp. NEAU-H3 TaxID=2720636 RepID=UPI001FD77B9C|nr:hypothetical protein [Streptomyces sp. NEAU-H3]
MQRIRLFGDRQEGAEHPLARRALLLLALLGVDPLAGVEAQQVLEPVAQLPGRVDADDVEELGVDEALHEPLGVQCVDVEERAADPGGEVGHVEQAEPPVEQRGLRGQVAVRQLEARAHLRAALAQLVQATALVGEARDEVADGPVRVGGEACRGDPQGERKPVAQFGEAHGVRRPRRAGAHRDGRARSAARRPGPPVAHGS